MRKYLSFLIILLCLSCDVDLGVKTYDYDWSLELPIEANTTFIKPFKWDKSIFVISQNQLTGNSGKIFRISTQGELESTSEIIFGSYILNQSPLVSTNGSVRFFGQKPEFNDKIGIFTISDQGFDQIEIDLQDQLLGTGAKFIALGTTGLYYEKSVGSDMKTLIKMDFTGEPVWELPPSQILFEKAIEGTDGIVITLQTDELGNNSLAFNDINGNEKWKKQITGIGGMVSEMIVSKDFFSSPSNTVNIFGTDQNGGLIMAIVDPRGNLVLQRTYVGLGDGAINDFITTSDGSFSFALSETIDEATSFTIVRLNFRGNITWRSNFISPRNAKKIYLTETVNDNVIISTDTGEVYNLVPLE